MATKKVKTIRIAGNVIGVGEAVYKWLEEFRTTEKGKVSFDEALHFLIEEYTKLKKENHNLLRDQGGLDSYKCLNPPSPSIKKGGI